MIESLRQYLAGSALGPTLIKAVVGSVGLRLVGMGFTFLVGVQLARGLGAEGYGIYGLAMSVVSILCVPTEFGLPQLLTREVAASHARGQWGRIHGIMRWAHRTVLWTSAIVAAVVIAALVVVPTGTGTELGATLLVGVTLVPLIALGNTNAGALRGLQHIVKGQVHEVALRPALFALFLFLAPFLWTLNATLAIALGSVAAALALLFVWMLLRSEMRPTAGSAAESIDARGWFSSALPLALTEGMRILQSQAAILCLGAMSTVSIIGIYRVAGSVAVMAAVPLSLLNVVSAPVIARLHAQGDRRRLQRMLTWVALGMFGSLVLLDVLFFFAGRQIFGLVFGPEFAPSSNILLAQMIGITISGLFGASSTLLNMTGHQGRVTRASLVSLLLLAALLPLMIWRFSGVGAALAGSVALTVWNVLMWRDAVRLTDLDTSVLAVFKLSRQA